MREKERWRPNIREFHKHKCSFYQHTFCLTFTKILFLLPRVAQTLPSSSFTISTPCTTHQSHSQTTETFVTKKNRKTKTWYILIQLIIRKTKFKLIRAAMRVAGACSLARERHETSAKRGKTRVTPCD